MPVLRLADPSARNTLPCPLSLLFTLGASWGLFAKKVTGDNTSQPRSQDILLCPLGIDTYWGQEKARRHGEEK